ncbi:hypothetical protein Z945_3456 [Sulfitobacter noctilucae]|nr:hypothetical protein Z945_3456 [Sulfitobacter noctilucae]
MIYRLARGVSGIALVGQSGLKISISVAVTWITSSPKVRKFSFHARYFQAQIFELGKNLHTLCTI